jgi:hypothetical protein
MTVIPIGNEAYQGASTDTKPTNVPANAQFYETDTYTYYVSDGSGGWNEKSNVLDVAYIVYPSGTKYKGKNCATGVVDVINTTPDIGATLSSCIANMSSAGGIIKIKPGNYTIQTNVNIPVAASGLVKPISFTGTRSNIRGAGTTFFTGSSFPSQTYMFQAVAASGSGQTASFEVKNITPVNNSFARSGISNQNIAGGTTIIDAGFILHESDNNTGIPLIVENITTQYLWRGIHLKGYLYWPVIRNYMATDINTNVVSDTHIIMEKGTHADYPKGINLDHIVLNTVAGSASGTGSLNNAIVFGGGYHNARHIFVDGTKYNNSVIAFMQCFSSSFYGNASEDLLGSGSQGAGFKGVVLFDSNDFSGNAGDSTHATYNNQIYDVIASPVPFSIAFRNGAFRNRIRAYGYWGSPLTIDDSGAGIENVIEVIEGQQPASIANTVITSTNGLVQILDRRAGSNKKGLSTQTGDGTTKVFTIAHGCFTTPVNYYVYPVSADAMGAFNVTTSSSNLTITYGFAPPSNGSNNLKWSWYADAYLTS